jgi:L-alanine-DL-glutamate epimerase-like enolase superfamily enzyme
LHGGILETKRTGDYAEKHGIPMAMHQAGTPVSMMANIHCAAATQNFLALEHHSVDLEWWPNLVKMTGGQPIFEKGYGIVPLDSPGLGIELNDDVIKVHMRKDEPGYFQPTPSWDQNRSGDWLFS